MGLDMEIRKMRKPSKNENEVYERCGLSGIILSEDEIELDMYKQLRPYCQILKIRSEYYDLEKMRKDYNLPENANIWSWSFNGIRIGASASSSVSISDSLIEEKYTISRVEDRYYCESEEVKYWRKEYDVQDWFHENIEGDVENTGYYMLDVDIINRFNKEFPDERFWPEEPTDESALFYWEWY